MKKQILPILIIVIITGVFISCSVNNGIDDISTTVVTDADGETHYYEVITDESETTALYEIEIEPNGKAVTEKNGTYITKAYTAVIPSENINDNTINSITSDTSKFKEDDNVVVFESTSLEENETTFAEQTSTENNKTTQSVTDENGWINKWY